MDSSYLDRERELIREYGCKIHDQGKCPGSPRFHGPRDGVDRPKIPGHNEYCLPNIPDWESPPYIPTTVPMLAQGASAQGASAQGASAQATIPIAYLEPSADEIAALALRGCFFGSAPWEGPPGSPHYGPHGSCINHRFPSCPSQNPYDRVMDQRRAYGLPIIWQSTGEQYQPSITLAPIKNSSMMKKKKHKKTKTQRARGRSPPTNRFDMTELADILSAATPGPVAVTPAMAAVVADPLVELMSQLRVNRRANNSKKTKQIKGRNKKKKGGRRTRKSP